MTDLKVAEVFIRKKKVLVVRQVPNPPEHNVLSITNELETKLCKQRTGKNGCGLPEEMVLSFVR